MKAVIYARYSSDNQREESIEGQLRECSAFAEKNGITILRHYIDRAFSAKTDNRPEFQNMIKDSGKRLFDMVIVWKLDRFARNRYDSARYKSLLKKNGVKVVSATEVISEGAEGIILESVLEGYAEYYSADLAEKVVRGMTDNALKCKFNGGTIPIGYVIDDEQHFQVDPITAPYVLEVFKRYDKGATMTELRDWLNEQGVKNTRGNPITYNSIQHMLCNRRYIGEFTFRDTVIPKGITAIVPDDLFDRVQKKLEVNKKAPARHKAEDDYLLTTKIFCGYCGAYLCGESGTGRNGVHHYYKCVSVKKKRTECECKPVRKAWIEDLVLNSIMEMLSDDRTIDAITSMVLAMQDQESVALPMYEQQLQEANTGINNLLNAIQQGILTKSTKSRLEELEAARDELENKIALEKLAKPRVSEEFVRFFLERFRNLDLSKLEHRKMLIEVFLNSVYVFNDKIVISCNYKDGTKTVNFSEMECALTQRASVSGSDLDCPGAPRQRNADPLHPSSFPKRRSLGGPPFQVSARVRIWIVSDRASLPAASFFSRIIACDKNKKRGAAAPRPRDLAFSLENAASRLTIFRFRVISIRSRFTLRVSLLPKNRPPLLCAVPLTDNQAVFPSTRSFYEYRFGFYPGPFLCFRRFRHRHRAHRRAAGDFCQACRQDPQAAAPRRLWLCAALCFEHLCQDRHSPSGDESGQLHRRRYRGNPRRAAPAGLPILLPIKNPSCLGQDGFFIGREAAAAPPDPGSRNPARCPHGAVCREH